MNLKKVLIDPSWKVSSWREEAVAENPSSQENPSQEIDVETLRKRTVRISFLVNSFSSKISTNFVCLQEFYESSVKGLQEPLTKMLPSGSSGGFFVTPSMYTKFTLHTNF